MSHDHIGHRSWQGSDLSIGRECQNLPFGRKNGITKTKRHRLPVNETADCEDSLTQRSWRRPPPAGKRHDWDQVTFVAQWAEKESFGDRGRRRSHQRVFGDGDRQRRISSAIIRLRSIM